MIKTCHFCGKKFETTRKNKIYCCLTCNKHAYVAQKYPKGELAKIWRATQQKLRNPRRRSRLTIPEIVVLAQAEGLSYGKYVDKYAL